MPKLDYVTCANNYARAVVKGEITASKLIRLACRRHLNDLRKKRWDYEFDEWHGSDVCDFIEKMPHVEGVWDEPEIRLEAPQIFILCCVFGWRRKSDGNRRFSFAYVEMARKGAKSTLTAGVSLYCLCCEEEPGAQVIIGATTGEQAQKVFGPAKKMVEKTADLREAFGVKAWARSITCDETGGFMQPINSKGKTQDGWNPHLGVLDELHAHPNRELFDVIQTAFGARKNPLMWIITTAGFNTNNICYEQRLYVEKVLKGVIDAPHVFGAIFTLDEGDDPFDESVWIKANPLLGVTPTLENMKAAAVDAKASPGSEANFKVKRLNVWQNAIGAWLSVDGWKACSDKSITWDSFDGLDCFIGGDLAHKNDITSMVLAAFDGDRLIFKPLFWLPEDVLKQADHAEGRGPAPYRTWVENEDLILTPGDWIDMRIIEDQLNAWCSRYRIVGGIFDEWGEGGQLAISLNAEHGEDLFRVMKKNASNITRPAIDLEARVKAGPDRLGHDGNAVMNWMASNAVVERRVDESLLPKKETKDSPNKIDGIDALLNAMVNMVLPEEEKPDSPWNNPEFQYNESAENVAV